MTMRNALSWFLKAVEKGGYIANVHVLSVNQLLETALDTARHVASSISTSTTPVPYTQMISQREALVIGKQRKMSVVMSFKRNPDPLLLPAPKK